MNTNQNQSPFGEIIYAYTRAQAVADGVQVDVTKTAQEAGIKFPVFITRTVFDAYVAVPEGVTGQDEAGRLWDIVWMLRFGILRSRPGCDRIPVALYVRNDNQRAKLIKLIAICGALDIDDPQAALRLVGALDAVAFAHAEHFQHQTLDLALDFGDWQRLPFPLRAVTGSPLA